MQMLVSTQGSAADKAYQDIEAIAELIERHRRRHSHDYCGSDEVR
jgi:hypothetical protein